MKTAVAKINLTALQHNLSQVKKLAPHSKIMAVCKANGYGHGLIQVAETLTQADAFGVARIEEALQLRAAGIRKTIVLLEGFFSAQDIPIIANHNFETVVHCLQQLEQIEQFHSEHPIKVWLKIDTGMSRLGIDVKQAAEFIKRLQACPHVLDDIVLMTHFACADELNNPYNQVQLTQFESIASQYQLPQSLANSAATISLPTTRQNWVRPGIMLYGVSPMEGETGKMQSLMPVMTLSSQLISVKPVKANTKVGYGSQWQTPQDTILGVVAIGYGDGYPRHAKNGTPIWLNGRLVPLVGRVSMDMLTIDLGPNSQDKIGDNVILWGDMLPIETIAKAADTIAYEMLCQLTNRVKWQYI